MLPCPCCRLQTLAKNKQTTDLLASTSHHAPLYIVALGGQGSVRTTKYLRLSRSKMANSLHWDKVNENTSVSWKAQKRG